ncbi:MAG: ABC transporter substrate-binding protein [Roseiflexaceae bacterium]
MHRLRLLLSLLLVTMVVAACAAPASTPATAVPAEPATAPTAAPAEPTAAPAASDAELRIGTGLNIAPSLIVTQGTVGYNMITYGAGEALMRMNRQFQLEPWLAEEVTQIDPLTWQIKLRSGVLFHDGSTMTASDVAESIKDSWANLAGATNFLSKESEIAVIDATTLTIKTPAPAGNVPNALANWNFVIHKPAQNDISILTGMYRPVKLEKDQEMVFERFEQYWGGVPPLARLIVKKIPDANARALALQSGDLDMLTNVPPDIADALPADITRTSVPGTRMHHIILNHTRAPFNDLAIRQAASLAIDREALLAATLAGQGAVASNMYPTSLGIPIVEAQITDLEQAQALLDQAGWKPGADGIREKDGRRLSFLLYSYPGRPELTQMAIAIQSQLQAVGFEVKVEEVADIVATIEGGEFQASMFSVNVSSDPQYMPGISLITGANFNYGGYSNSAFDALFEQLRGEGDPAKRQELAKQLQEIVEADTPNIYLAVPPLITAFREGSITGYSPYADDLYLVTRELGLSR